MAENLEKDSKLNDNKTMNNRQVVLIVELYLLTGVLFRNSCKTD